MQVISKDVLRLPLQVRVEYGWARVVTVHYQSTCVVLWLTVLMGIVMELSWDLNEMIWNNVGPQEIDIINCL